MDTLEDMAVYSARAEIRRDRRARPCESYEPTSRIISECAHCGHNHAVTFYELAPDLAVEKGAKYLAISYDGKTEYINELPPGREVVGLPGGNA